MPVTAKKIRFYKCRIFPEFAKRVYSSTRCVFGFKLHLAFDERGKIVVFHLLDGSRHDVKEAENLLRGCIGTAIGDKGYCSSQVRERLERAGLRFINEDEKQEHGR